jgi:hypothetical protein
MCCTPTRTKKERKKERKNNEMPKIRKYPTLLHRIKVDFIE